MWITDNDGEGSVCRSHLQCVPVYWNSTHVTIAICTGNRQRDAQLLEAVTHLPRIVAVLWHINSFVKTIPLSVIITIALTEMKPKIIIMTDNVALTASEQRHKWGRDVKDPLAPPQCRAAEGAVLFHCLFNTSIVDLSGIRGPQKEQLRRTSQAVSDERWQKKSAHIRSSAEQRNKRAFYPPVPRNKC